MPCIHHRTDTQTLIGECSHPQLTTMTTTIPRLSTRDMSLEYFVLAWHSNNVPETRSHRLIKIQITTYYPNYERKNHIEQALINFSGYFIELTVFGFLSCGVCHCRCFAYYLQEESQRNQAGHVLDQTRSEQEALSALVHVRDGV